MLPAFDPKQGIKFSRIYVIVKGCHFRFPLDLENFCSLILVFDEVATHYLFLQEMLSGIRN
jgi:hypothetical protein